MNNSLALVMIVRDEARCITRCLASARPWVDEMVVLDTGSRDDTIARARTAGARVHHFEWVDDFAAARNAALAHCAADWCLVLDADEWIRGGAECLNALRSEPGGFIGQVQVVSGFGDGGAESPSWLPRVLPRGARYTGRIHEQPELALPRRRLGLVVGHDGCLGPQLQGKAGRNERLLRLMLAEHPDDPYAHYQLGKDLELRGRFEAAAPHYQHAHAQVEPRAAWRHDLVLRLMFTLKKLARFDAAMQLAARERPCWQDSPDFHFTFGDLLLDWAASAPQRAATLLPMIEAAWMQALAIGEQPALNDSVRGRGSFLAAHNLAVLHAGPRPHGAGIALARARAAHARPERRAGSRLKSRACRPHFLASPARRAPTLARNTTFTPTGRCRPLLHHGCAGASRPDPSAARRSRVAAAARLPALAARPQPRRA